MAQKKKLANKVDKRARGRVRIGTDANGKPIYKWVSAPTRRELDAKLEELRKSTNGESGVDPERITLAEYAEIWLDLQKARLKPSTAHMYLGVLHARILPQLGARKLRSILPSDIQRAMNSMEDKRLNYVKKVLGVLRGIFGTALADGIIERDPTARLALVGKPQVSRRALTLDERKALEAVLQDGRKLRHLFAALLYYCGLRASEALGLRWEDVDVKGAVVHVRRSIDASTGLPGTTKTAAGVRDVPMPPQLAELLRGRVGIGWIFSGRDGEPMRYNNCVHRWWEPLIGELQDAGKRMKLEIGDGITPHYLRHTYASILYASGVDVVQAQRWLGHESISTTLGIYTHISSQAEDENRAKIADGFALLPNGCQPKEKST